MSNRSYVNGRKPAAAALLGASSVAALAETFKVLGDETRVRILDVLARTELCVQDLARVLGLTQSAVSHQLRLLRSMRLVRTRRDGRQIFYALDDDHIVKLFEQGLEHVEERGYAGTRVGTEPRARTGSARGLGNPTSLAPTHGSASTARARGRRL
jgi:ArsR family transcriptional regulator, lead/cadmium/zinc/bismuth-responsive transcriptional repressor